MRRAHRDGLIEPPISDESMKWGTLASLTPVLFFTLSIPLAFLTTTAIAACTWFLTVPASMLFDRRRPPDVAAELGDLA